MMITSISYLILQVPAAFMSEYSDKQVAAGEKLFAAIGFFVCIGLFVGYIAYQYYQSEKEQHDVAEMKRQESTISLIRAGQLSLKGALYYEIMHVVSIPRSLNVLK